MKNLIKIALIPALFLIPFTVWGQSHGWTVNPSDYDNDCDVNAIVSIGAGEVTTGTVGAFVGGVCRGFGDGEVFTETGKFVFLIRCRSNELSGEVMSFQYFDPAGSLYYSVNETVEFIADAQIGSAADPLLFNIDENTPPVLSPIGDKSVCQSSPLEFTASAADSDVPANTLTFSIADAPAGASINPSTGTFTWTPDVTTVPGIYTFSVVVTDNGVPALSDEEKINVTVTPLPAQPGAFTASTATVCSGTSNVAYTVPDDPAVTYSWNYSGSGAVITGTASSVTVDYSAAATSGTLSVTATNSCGTSTARTLDITVNAVPAAPVIGEITQPTCSVATGSVELTGLPATGTWTLTQTPGGESSGTGTSTIVSSLAPGSYTFAVTSAGCFSLPSAEAVILAQPSPPTLSVGTVTNPTTCLGNGSIVLNFTNIPDGTYTITYSTGSFSEVVVAGSLATLQTPAGTYNNLQVTYDGCTSATGVSASISDPAAPTVTGVTSGSRCGPGTVILGATASEGLIKWYSEAFGGESLYTGVSFTTPVISTNTAYYVDATNNGCTTPTRTLVLAVVNTVPTVVNTVPGSRCGTGTVTLGATPSEGTVSWYSELAGGTFLGTGTSYTTLPIIVTTTYYVDATSNGCTSPTRTSVTATVNPIPAITGTTPDSRCGNGAVTLGAAASSGIINWYAASSEGVSLGTGISFTTPPLGESTTYWVDATDLGCISTPRSSVTATIKPVPASPVHTVDCSLGFNFAVITVTNPVGDGYQYRLNNGSYQVSPVFTEVLNGSYTITVINSSGCTVTGTSFDVSCGCVNGPSVTLASNSGITCGTAPVTVAGNTFGGSAQNVTISENGDGNVSPGNASSSPFSFTYTPAAGDIGKTVTVTVTTDNPLGEPCATASASYILTVYAIPAITGTTPGSRCGTGSVELGAIAGSGTVNWYSGPAGGSSLGTGTSYTTLPISVTTTYYVDATSNGCTTAERTAVIATVLQVPAAAGPVTGPATFTPGTTGVTYSVSPISGATGYSWSYSGTGVAINGSGNSVTLDFSANATSGVLSVSGNNTCGSGTASTLGLSPSTKTLNLTSVLLEGLYDGAGIMMEAVGDSGPQWGTGVADHITVELHDAANYGSIVWSDIDVTLSTDGKAVVTVPGKHNGSYYITVKHRNSIETTTSSPVSFAGAVIDRPFGLPSGIYGANLIASGDGYYMIFGGDVNQDGIVDTGDMNEVDNGSTAILIGYNAPDVNGDGIVDTSDMNTVDNNSTAIVIIILPF